MHLGISLRINICLFYIYRLISGRSVFVNICKYLHVHIFPVCMNSVLHNLSSPSMSCLCSLMSLPCPCLFCLLFFLLSFLFLFSFSFLFLLAFLYCLVLHVPVLYPVPNIELTPRCARRCAHAQTQW